MEVLELDKVDVKSVERKRIKLSTGISDNARSEIAHGLSTVLADTYCLMLMTQNYHWNIKGMHFKAIHEITEEHYQEMFPAIDDIAERIRQLGYDVPGTLNDFNEMTSINVPNSKLSEQEMVADLLEGHEAVTRTIRKTIEPAAEANDEATVDLLTARLQFHEKAAWMFRSMLEQ